MVAEHGPKIAAAFKKGNDAIPAELRKARAEAIKKARKEGKKPSEVVTAFKLSPEQQEAVNAAQKESRELRRAFNKAVTALLSEEQRKAIRPAKGAKKPSDKRASDKKQSDKKPSDKKPAA